MVSYYVCLFRYISLNKWLYTVHFFRCSLGQTIFYVPPTSPILIAIQSHLPPHISTINYYTQLPPPSHHHLFSIPSLTRCDPAPLLHPHMYSWCIQWGRLVLLCLPWVGIKVALYGVCEYRCRGLYLSIDIQLRRGCMYWQSCPWLCMQWCAVGLYCKFEGMSWVSSLSHLSTIAIPVTTKVPQ